MRFAHLGDCHLGGWRQPELMALNLESFHYAIKKCIDEKVDFVLVAGDLFDSAYPPIEIIKEAFQAFRKLKEANIPVFLIAGSHDYSASGKTFLDVLVKAGFCENVFVSEEKDGKIMLQPTIFKNIAIYGYPGKKSGLEVQDVERIKLQDALGLFRILMLHTTMRDAIGSLPILAVDQSKLPKVDYTALAHLHIKYNREGRVYCGPTFPNNSEELEELKGGSFYIVNTSSPREPQKYEINLKEVLILNIEITNALTATEKILDKLRAQNLKDKIIILKIAGSLEIGKTSDIRFNEIDEFVKSENAYVLLKNVNKLKSLESETNIEIDSDNIEEEIITKYQEDNQHEFNSLILPLISSLQLDKKEDEKSAVFEERLHSEIGKVINI